YSFSELRDGRVVPQCEVMLITDWLKASKEMLSIATRGRDLAEAPYLSGAGARCDGISTHAKGLPILDGQIKSTRLPSRDHIIFRTAFATYLCWVPEEYLP